MYNVAVDFAPQEGLTVADKENQTMWQNSQSETIMDPIILAELAFNSQTTLDPNLKSGFAVLERQLSGPKKANASWFLFWPQTLRLLQSRAWFWNSRTRFTGFYTFAFPCLPRRSSWFCTQLAKIQQLSIYEWLTNHQRTSPQLRETFIVHAAFTRVDFAKLVRLHGHHSPTTAGFATLVWLVLTITAPSSIAASECVTTGLFWSPWCLPGPRIWV